MDGKKIYRATDKFTMIEQYETTNYLCAYCVRNDKKEEEEAQR